MHFLRLANCIWPNRCDETSTWAACLYVFTSPHVHSAVPPLHVVHGRSRSAVFVPKKLKTKSPNYTRNHPKCICCGWQIASGTVPRRRKQIEQMERKIWSVLKLCVTSQLGSRDGPILARLPKSLATPKNIRDSDLHSVTLQRQVL